MESGPVFIGGLDRCGKTTMRAFLASHPNISIPGVGSNMWTYFYGQFGSLAKEENFERCLGAMLRYKHVRYLRPDPERIRREFRDGEPTYARLFALFQIHHAQRHGKPRWGDQTGLIERYAEHLFTSYPGVRVIHMIRDPRDRYEASLAAWPNGRLRAGGATARWRYSERLAQRNLRRYPDRYLVVRFEDMVIAPQDTIRGVCDFLGETFVPDMMTMKDAPEHRAKLLNGADDDAGPHPLNPDHIGGFRARVAKHETAFIQLHAGRQMRAHGYTPDQLQLTAPQWLRFAAIDWPNQLSRMLAWRTVEELHQRLPAIVGRQPGDRMIVEAA